MVVIQNIINDSNVDEDSLSTVCQNFLNENALEDSELLIRLVSPVEIQVLNKEYRDKNQVTNVLSCLLYTSPSPRDGLLSRMPSSA